MSQLSINTTSLQEILEVVNALPEAGGVELPELSNPAAANEIFLGEEVIDGEGNKMTGTFTIDNELSTQETLLSELKTILQNKAANNNPTDSLAAVYLDGIITKNIQEISSNTTHIGGYVFQSCTNLTTVNFPQCTSIYSRAFFGCRSLSSAIFPKCLFIGSSAFANCDNLSIISFPRCSYIQEGAFSYCLSLTSINFPRCLTVSYRAFSRCYSLTSATFLRLTTLNTSAFYDCSNFTTFVLNTSSVCKLTGDPFSSTPISNSTLTGYFGSIYVPASLVNAYKSATNWAQYSNRITAIDDTIIIEDSNDPIEFELDNIIYYADYDMTWGEWINSSYNTGGWIVDQYGNIRSEKGDRGLFETLDEILIDGGMYHSFIW